MYIILFLFSLSSNTLAQSTENLTTIFRWNIPALADDGTNHKVITLYKYPDNYTLININSNINPHTSFGRADEIPVFKKTDDGIFLDARIFQKIYLFLTSEKKSTKINDEMDVFHIDKFQEGSIPFHVIIKREFIDDDNKRIYRGIYLDAIEYKFLVSRASQIMRNAGI